MPNTAIMARNNIIILHWDHGALRHAPSPAAAGVFAMMHSNGFSHLQQPALLLWTVVHWANSPISAGAAAAAAAAAAADAAMSHSVWFFTHQLWTNWITRPMWGKTKHTHRETRHPHLLRPRPFAQTVSDPNLAACARGVATMIDHVVLVPSTPVGPLAIPEHV